MKQRTVRACVVVAFAIALGHLAWHALFGPAPLPEYLVQGEGPALCGRSPDDHHLYVRREIYLSQRPRHAWLQVLARDRLRVYVNGKFLGQQALPGFPVAVVADLAPYLQVGRNCIALSTEQATIGKPPVITVTGAYAYDDQEYALGVDALWRCSPVFERTACWWFETDFDDRHWPAAQRTACHLRGRVKAPPRAVTEVSQAQWITPAELEANTAAVRREFEIADRPRQAWLRVTATGSYRLALNGILLDQQEGELGGLVAAPVVQRIYDITPVMRRGQNVLALVLTGIAGRRPHVLVDGEVEDSWGRRQRVRSDAHWLGRPGLRSDWLALARDHEYPGWQPCYLESGDLLIPPWRARRQTVELDLPFAVVLRHTIEQLGLMALVAFLTLLACRFAVHRLSLRTGRADRAALVPLVYLALVPATVAIAAGVLATYDPRIARQDVYRGVWVLLVVLSVCLQWRFLAWRAQRQGSGPRLLDGIRATGLGSRWIAVVLISLLVLGAWLRLREIALEGLQWDEVENYHATLGFLERGFPNIRVHEDLPLLYIHTSELQFIPMALAALVFKDSAYVVRFPSVCWGLLTTWLLYRTGRHWFNTPVGLVAATLYTLAPVCIAMSNFGRYFSQLQFFTLLTLYYFWLTIRGTGPIDRRALWLTTLSFLGMFLSWEASALIAPGMVLAALVQRRGRLHSLLGSSSVWTALVVIGLVILLQSSHVILQQTQFLWYGISLSDVKLIPMWRYPIPGVFQPWYYVWQSSWNQDALLPLLGLGGAYLLALRHPLRRRIRYLGIIHLTKCLFMAFLLPNTQWRYIHHLVPLLILLASVSLVTAARYLVKMTRHIDTPEWGRSYAWGISLGAVLVLMMVSSGSTVELRDMDRFRIEGPGVTTYKFPNLAGAARYVRAHMQEGDVMLANNVYQINHLMGLSGQRNRPTDFMPATGPFLPGTLDDHRALVLDRRDGAKMLSTPESIVDLFARNRRIWYVLQPGQHYILNTPDVSTFLRQHMDVVYQDWEALVLFRGDQHRPAEMRLDNERALRDAQANFLP